MNILPAVITMKAVIRYIERSTCLRRLLLKFYSHFVIIILILEIEDLQWAQIKMFCFELIM